MPNEDDCVKITFKQRTLDFMDAHPRTGWYIAIASSINVLLNLLNLFVE
jgi:hypothetical protein